MARSLVHAEGVTKTVAGRILFEDAAFQVEAGERLALVGPNGAGKTTLLRMVLGLEKPEHGFVRVSPQARIAHVAQHDSAPPGATVRDVLAAEGDLPPGLATELAELEARIADPALYESAEADDVLARYGELTREAGLARARAGSALDDPIVAALGITEEDMSKPFAPMSGGEKARVLLARGLSKARGGNPDGGGANPDAVLILDEPTNHLDLESIEWLEEHLLESPYTVIVVAHDRAFLDNVATRVLSIERERLLSYPGNYSEFERRREEDAQRLANIRERESKELARQEAVIQQFRHQKRFNGQMASRLTALQKYRSAIDRTPDPLIEKLQARLAVAEAWKSSNEMIRVRGLGKRVGDRVLFHDVDLDLMKGDRVGLVGANGSGKSTLLRILTGQDNASVGNIEAAPGVKGAYFAQGAGDLEPKRTLEAEVRHARRDLEDEEVRALLGRFGFRNAEDPRRTVQTLSGGERARLSLLKTLLKPVNLLVLDEPTNHLDIQSRGELARALNAFKGSLVVVSHDRFFLDSVVDKVAVLANGTMRTFIGDLSDARVATAIDAFGVAKPTRYLVKKAFKDFDEGTKYRAGSVLELTPEDVQEKRLYRTALELGWMVEE